MATPVGRPFFCGVPMTLLSTVYCTEAQMDLYLSSQGVIDFADHDADGTSDSGVTDDCINQATEEIDLYCRQRYTQAVLATSTLIERWAVVMAARFLCQRRGNKPPDSLEEEFQRITDPDNGFLAKIAAGKRQLPGKALRATLQPTWSNLTVDRRYRRSKIRVTDANSSDANTELSQDKARDVPQTFYD